MSLDFGSDFGLIYLPLGGALYTGSPSHRSAVLLWLPDCYGEHSLRDVQPAHSYLH